jgi:predicted RecA/RadA family phage recombinase
MMEASEFNTIVQNGVIRIPKQLSDKNISYVKVILLSDKVSHTATSGRKSFRQCV